ncbi:MAG: F0F1 ATP synthase subunit A [Candidatus Margulisiibacteriota bacterium]
MENSGEAVKILFPLSIFGVDISITSAVVVVWVTCFIIFAFSFIASRKVTAVPGKIQNIIEMIYEFFEQQTGELLGKYTVRWLPFIFSIFCFVLVSNLLGLVPDVYPTTSNINVTASLAIFVFVVYQMAGIAEHGFLQYFRSYVPKGVPVFIAPVLFVIEFVGHLARPFSLAIRLFANVTAGHLVAFTILSLIFIFKSPWLAPFPLMGKVAISIFEVFISFIQAYLFAYLSALYIGLAVNEE